MWRSSKAAMSTTTMAPFGDAPQSMEASNAYAPTRPWNNNGVPSWEDPQRDPSMGARTKTGVCTWELPSVARPYDGQAGISPVYGASAAPCGCHTAADVTGGARPLRTYHRAEYFNEGCTAPPQLTRWASAHLNALFDDVDAFQAAVPPTCSRP
jgi:hypothetical protein